MISSFSKSNTASPSVSLRSAAANLTFSISFIVAATPTSASISISSISSSRSSSIFRRLTTSDILPKSVSLVRDKDFLREFAGNLARIGQTVEVLFGVPQDIEGAYSGGRYSVVQTRPQVGVGDG